jgi:hypothetical protein
MKHNHTHFLTLTVALTSTAAHAHEGEHAQQTLQWLAHLFSSSHHLLALFAVAALVGIAASARRWLKTRRARLNANTTQTTVPVMPLGKR